MDQPLIILKLTTSIAAAGLLTSCATGPDMAVIQATSFQMGETIDYGYGEIDGPQHEVVFSQKFAIATTEVTVGEFREFISATGYTSGGDCNIYTDEKPWHVDPARSWDDPGFEQNEDHPVVCVSWDDAVAYANWMSERYGMAYRLPTEAEWEYVASTGGVEGSDGIVGNDEANIGVAPCCGGKVAGRDHWVKTAPVASFPADIYGIYDIRGNVWEWQADCHQEMYDGAPVDGSARTVCETQDKRAIRGGSYGDAGNYLSPRYRLPGPRSQGYFTVGFRLARDID